MSLFFQLSLSEEDLQKKQFQLKCWLLKNRLPIEVGGAKGELLTLADALVIHPPYGADNCYSTNEIILGKIQGLIKNMPADQEDWWRTCYDEKEWRLLWVFLRFFFFSSPEPLGSLVSL